MKLVPDDAVSHYNLGALYRVKGRMPEAIEQFRVAAKLDPTLAAPHFQLFNALRTSGRTDEAKPELETIPAPEEAAGGGRDPRGCRVEHVRRSVRCDGRYRWSGQS